jgi:hypothetical protein
MDIPIPGTKIFSNSRSSHVLKKSGRRLSPLSIDANDSAGLPPAAAAPEFVGASGTGRQEVAGSATSRDCSSALDRRAVRPECATAIGPETAGCRMVGIGGRLIVRLFR